MDGIEGRMEALLKKQRNIVDQVQTLRIYSDQENTIATSSAAVQICDELNESLRTSGQSESTLLSQLNSADISTHSRSLESFSSIIQLSTLPNGDLDCNRLQQLIYKQRQFYRDKLNRQKAKRIEMEELLLNYEANRRSSTTTDSERLTAELSKHREKKQTRSCDHRKRDEQSSSDIGSSNLSTPKPTNDCATSPERFYRSTAVFDVSNKSTDLKRQKITHPVNKRRIIEPSSSGLRMTFPAGTTNQLRPRPPNEEYWVDLNGMPSAQRPVQLQESLSINRPRFITSCYQRLEKMKKANGEREDARRRIRQIAENVAQGKLTPEDGLRLQDSYRLTEIRAFSHNRMVTDTRKRAGCLPEFVARRKEKERRFQMATNRALAEMFKQRLSYKLQLNKRSTIFV